MTIPNPGMQSNGADIAQMTTWLRGLVDPNSDSCVEVRALHVREGRWKPYTASGFFDYDHLPEMAKAAYDLSGKAAGVYWTLNPLHRDLLARRCNRIDRAEDKGLASDDHVLRRRWLLIDCDPERIAGISSTDAEKAAALELAQTVRHYLTGRGWPLPVLADSGNGYHLLYRVDLAAKDGGFVERTLKGLAARFAPDKDDQIKVKIDTAVYNPARIVKLYGTTSCKGDHTAERPHRTSAILEGLDNA